MSGLNIISVLMKCDKCWGIFFRTLTNFHFEIGAAPLLQTQEFQNILYHLLEKNKKGRKEGTSSAPPN